MAWVPTTDIVQDQIAKFTAKGDVAFNVAIDALRQIASSFEGGMQDSGIAFGGGHGLSAAEMPTYTKPVPEPDEPNIEFKKPDGFIDPPTAEGVERSIEQAFSRVGDVPQFTITAPSLTMPSLPGALTAQKPNDPDPFNAPSYPTDPTIENPELGALFPITLPVLTPIDLSRITAQIEELRNNIPEAPTLPANIDYFALVEQFYAVGKDRIADVLVNLVPRLGELLSGSSTGLSNDVAELLRSRAFAAEDKQAIQAEQEVIVDWLSRGFTLPGGALETRLLAVRQANRDKKAQLNRDLWIEEAKQEIENLRWAIQQGIAYEGMHKDSILKLYGLCGQLAEQSVNAQLKLVEAAVEIYKAKMQMWQIQFSVIKDEIQIELAKVEVFKAELEGQRLVSQLNQQVVDVYKARLEAVQQSVMIYKARIDAANGILQGELGKLEYATKRIQIYTAEVSAYEAEWRAYGESVRGELGKAELYKALVQAYAARVDAYGRSVDAAKTKASLSLEGLNSEIKAWEALTEKYKTELQSETVRVESLAKTYDSTVRAFAVKGQSEDSYVNTELKKLEYLLNVDKFNADLKMKEAELEQTKTLELAKMTVSAMDSVARTGSQLSGSAMSAMNVGASLSSGSSSTYSESHNYSHEA